MPTDPDALQQRLQVALQTIKDNDAALAEKDAALAAQATAFRQEKALPKAKLDACRVNGGQEHDARVPVAPGARIAKGNQSDPANQQQQQGHGGSADVDVLRSR